MRTSLLLIKSLLVGSIAGAQVQHINPICDIEKCQKSCDSTCQSTIQAAYNLEWSQWVGDVFADPFYNTPDLTKAKPGDLLKWEDVPSNQMASNWSVPAGLSFSRFMYVTEDIDGKPIPATAWALLPFSNSFSSSKKGQGHNKLRTIVWNHGTAGINPNCAPSNQKTLQYGWRAPYQLASSGYAVIGPDYAGLGSRLPQGFMYMSGYLHAGDSAYSLVAARKAIGSLLSDEWVAMGHSEGGQTTWRTNERLAMPGQENLRAATGMLLGVVPVAPVLRPGEPVVASIAQDGRAAFTSVYFMRTLQKIFPGKFDAANYLGNKVVERLGVLENSCFDTASVTTGTVSGADIFKDATFWDHPVLVDWIKRYNRPGPHPLAAPMLIVHGTADPFPASASIHDYDLTCNAYPKSPLNLRLYNGMSHIEALEASKGDVLEWIDQRFDGVPVKQACVKEEVASVGKVVGTMGINWVLRTNQPCGPK